MLRYPRVKDIVKIKDIFPKLSADKVLEIHKVINNSSQKSKPRCYNLSSMLNERHTLVLSNTRELDRVSKYKTSTLYTNYWWSMLHSFSPILMTMCLPWDWHVLTMLYDIIVFRIFYVVPSCHVSMWLWLVWPQVMPMSK